MKTSLGAKVLAHPTPVWCVGSYDADGNPNVMTAAWGGVVCSKPPCVGVSLRPATYSHGNLVARKAFTVSVPGAAQAEVADYFGMASGKDADKFAVTGTTAVASEAVDAPYVGEFPLVLECKVLHVHDLGMHTQFVGEIMDVKADAGILDAEGKIDMAKLSPLVYATGTRDYWGLGARIGGGFDMGKKLLGK